MWVSIEPKIAAKRLDGVAPGDFPVGRDLAEKFDPAGVETQLHLFSIGFTDGYGY